MQSEEHEISPSEVVVAQAIVHRAGKGKFVSPFKQAAFKRKAHPGSGRRKGQTGGGGGKSQKIAAVTLAAKYGNKMQQIAEDLLDSPRKAEQQWAWERLLPYIFQKQPTAVHTGQDPNAEKAGVTVEFINVGVPKAK